MQKGFVAWMDEHSILRTVCEEGKGKLSGRGTFLRMPGQLLQNLANSDFQKNLGKIIHDLTGHNLFKDMHRVTTKKRAKYQSPPRR